MHTRTLTLLLMLAALLGLMVWSFIAPYDRQVWWTEMSMVFLLLAVFGGFYSRLKLSTVSYFFIFLWCYLQVVGAHYCIAALDLRNKPWINEKLSAQPASHLPPTGKPSAGHLPAN